MINEDYVSFETAKLLKDKGFDGQCLGMYAKNGYLLKSNFKRITNSEKREFPIDAPTLQMAMKWLREHSWVICVLPLTFRFGEVVGEWGYNIWADDNLEIDEYNTPKFKSYEEACEAAIKYCLENLI